MGYILLCVCTEVMSSCAYEGAISTFVHLEAIPLCVCIEAMSPRMYIEAMSSYVYICIGLYPPVYEWAISSCIYIGCVYRLYPPCVCIGAMSSLLCKEAMSSCVYEGAISSCMYV